MKPNGLTDLLNRQHRWFLVLVMAFVVICSFLWGLVSGVDRRLQVALAAPGRPLAEGASVAFPFSVSKGLRLHSVANDLAVNGQASVVAQFESQRSAGEVLRDQIAAWKTEGYVTLEASPGQRGIGMAHDPGSGRRAAIFVSGVPPGFRSRYRGARSVGMISSAERAGSTVGEPLETGGAVPGVPVMPGGKGGAVVSARDPEGRTQTGIYTNPGDVEENLAYYIGELQTRGWRAVESFTGERNSVRFGSAVFTRERDEVSLLFSGRGAEAKTAVLVVRAKRPAGG